MLPMTKHVLSCREFFGGCHTPLVDCNRGTTSGGVGGADGHCELPIVEPVLRAGAGRDRAERHAADAGQHGLISAPHVRVPAGSRTRTGTAYCVAEPVSAAWSAHRGPHL